MLSIASCGGGTSLHLSSELFKAMVGVALTYVPYRGSASGLTDVMFGQIQGMFDSVTSSFELMRAGKLRARRQRASARKSCTTCRRYRMRCRALRPARSMAWARHAARDRRPPEQGDQRDAG
jgi:hypothetical protein